MKVQYWKEFWCSCGNSMYPHKGIRIKQRHERGCFRGYDYTITKFCCDDMQEATEYKFICFGERDEYLGKDCNINIISCSPYPECVIWNIMAINVCPFCGEKIILEEIIK